MRLLNFLPLRSIRLQLMAGYLVALLLAAGAIALMLLYLFDWSAEDSTAKKGLVLQADWIEETLEFDANGTPLRLDPASDSAWFYGAVSADLQYEVLDADGKRLFGSAPHGGDLLHPDLWGNQLSQVSRRMIGGIPFSVLTRPLTHKGATYHIRVARSERLNTVLRDSIGRPVLKTAVWVSVVSLLLLVGVVHLTLRRSLRPLQEASEAAARIEPGNLSKRLDTSGLPSELTPLVESFNKALDRLERGYRVQQEFLAGAAHELKTPLSLIRAQIELGGATDRVALLGDIDMMARQVHQLLHLADVSESHNYVFAPTSVPVVAGEVTRYLARLADMRRVTLHMSSTVLEGRTAPADRSAVFILLKNLIENAIRHACVGGTVMVSIEDDCLYVQDDGAGIAAEDFPRLYARFWRGADRRDDGAGLGLAICHEIVATHGWSIAAANVWPGARFTVHFLNMLPTGK